MPAKKTLFRVAFHNQGQLYEVYARRVSHGELLGFVEVEELVFGAKGTLVVDPSEERLQREFEGVRRFFVPMHAVVRIDEVEKEGPARILEAAKGATVAPVPGAADPSRGASVQVLKRGVPVIRFRTLPRRPRRPGRAAPSPRAPSSRLPAGRTAGQPVATPGPPPAPAAGRRPSRPSSGRRPKVGLVLSGGGARGAAHVGVLRVLREHADPDRLHRRDEHGLDRRRPLRQRDVGRRAGGGRRHDRLVRRLQRQLAAPVPVVPPQAGRRPGAVADPDRDREREAAVPAWA